MKDWKMGRSTALIEDRVSGAVTQKQKEAGKERHWRGQLSTVNAEVVSCGSFGRSKAM